MKKLNARLCLLAALALSVTLIATSCNGEADETETPTETVSVSETESESTSVESQSETETETVTETETETETLRELVWETYDASLDNSVVNTEDEHIIHNTQWIATDGLGRVVSTNTTTGDQDKEKIVAIFYWTWHGDFANQGQKAFNNQQNIDTLIANGYAEKDYIASNFTNSTVTSFRKIGVYTNTGGYHFWDEPVYGYYSANDEWVVRKQAELLAAADIDVVFFDNTNGTYTWMQSAKTVMKVFSEARAQGVDAPDVSFMLPFAANSDTVTQLKQLYKEIYQKDYCSDVWFELDGKPMLMAHGSALNQGNAEEREIYNYFTFRANVAGYTAVESSSNQWGWLSRYPQAYFHDADGNIEQMTVGVAVNHDYVNRVIAPMSLGTNVIGRTWTTRGIDTRENAVLYGACFAEQWENALTVDPEIVFVTAWNEWVAMRISHWSAASGYDNCFVDQYNAEYSRDCEPSTGILKDHYYYQLADYVRQFKGAEPIEQASWEKLIDVNGGYGQWADVTPVYNDYFGLPDRDALGYTDPATGKRLHYTNDTGRNDVYDAKVARDYENIYFMVRTVEDLTAYTDADWMNLYIDMGESDANWENYEFILNKQNPENETTAILEKFTGDGYKTEVVGKVTYAVKGNVLTVCIPKTMLGIPAEQLDFEFGFKWTDNTGVTEDGDIMKWYVNGEVAPVGRFNYCYTTTGSAEYVETEDKGSALIDFTDEAMRDILDDGFLPEDPEGMTYELTDEGLKITSTDKGSKAEFILDYEKISPAVVTEYFDAVSITYKVVSEGTEGIRVSMATGKVNEATSSRARSIDLEADGETHTLTKTMQDFRASSGYLHQIGIYFDKTAAAGQSIVIEKIEFIVMEDAE